MTNYDPSTIFTEEELRKIRMFGVSVANSIIPLQYKDFFYISTGQIWDIDTYTIESCKCLTMNEKDFKEYLRWRVYDENRVGEESICRVCYTLKVPSFMELKSCASFADEIIICEAGRGIDVLLATLVKPWKRIVAYDQDKSVLYEMKKYFKGELGLPFEVQQINSLNYNFEGINEKTVVFGTCHNVNADKQKEISGNENLLGLFDGHLLIK